MLLFSACLFLIPGAELDDSPPLAQEWHSAVYTIDIGFRFASRCLPGECENARILTLVSSVRNVIFGHSPSPSFPCWFYSRSGSNLTPVFGHGMGKAQIIDVEMCPHLSGGGEEAQRIVGRNNDFKINLMILSHEAAEATLKAKSGYDEEEIVPSPIQKAVWMQFQARTPFDNPAVEWENSDGNGLMNNFGVIFHVYLDDLKENREVRIEVPESDECGEGIWSIQFTQKVEKI